ncbi:M20 family metallo-hydrolase [Pseudodesulfovibrio piezophilus]|uniref:Putative enzyme n=1 Tax=Pseudodesulfovibrio piezophilus (strain DSM 21447 / JCM 15486 / C1TLV30) TaxID=1322246 RepID=M1WLF4_PSEP2|nr:M20 family metallo-hydrolase [Pseudodesulfovibrio piezophilus]CCH47770.1 putative enzyme [Pseudodesulfovibrio piezophilus C1TLV30]
MDIIFSTLDQQAEEVVTLQSSLTALPALGPINGGDGEKDKADFLLTKLKSIGVPEIRELNTPAKDVSCGYRPNIAGIIPGKNTEKTLWVISHIDVVPPGDESLWNSNPYELVRDGDMIYGRGVEDNQQGIVSSLLAAQALLDHNVTPEINFGLLFVADEETGSVYGLDYLVEHHAELFKTTDLFLVPDFGEPQSEMVEVAEKSMFWLKVVIDGKQCHASTPDEGINTLVPAAAFILKIKKLEEIFNAEDPIYNPPRSTFQPTMKEANVTNVNTIPGRDIFYIDCRVMPEYDLDDVLNKIKEFGQEVAQEYGVTISYEVPMREQAAPATPVESEIVQKVITSVKRIYKNNPRPVGVGGGTVAAFLRRKGFQAVVWATLNHNAHQPNESASIKSTLGDAKVIADILIS